MNERQLLRHFLAALAYRTQKALRGAPDGYPDFRAGRGLRTPHEILWHMTSVLGYARTHFVGGEYRPRILEEFEREVEAPRRLADPPGELYRGRDRGGERGPGAAGTGEL